MFPKRVLFRKAKYKIATFTARTLPLELTGDARPLHRTGSGAREALLPAKQCAQPARSCRRPRALRPSISRHLRHNKPSRLRSCAYRCMKRTGNVRNRSVTGAKTNSSPSPPRLQRPQACVWGGPERAAWLLPTQTTSSPQPWRLVLSHRDLPVGEKQSKWQQSMAFQNCSAACGPQRDPTRKPFGHPSPQPHQPRTHTRVATH